MQLPIINGIYTDQVGDFRQFYPVNYLAVPLQQGISNGYLRPAPGIVEQTTGAPGISRGGINWNGVCYRVLGTKLCSIDAQGVVTTIGDVGGSGQVTFDYSFDYLAVCSSGKFYLYNGTALQQVTDPDLKTVIDFIWVDGYFMTTDGTYLITTELNNPFSVLPTKYGSSEADPDPIVAIKKLHNEPNAINRYTIEVFNDIGGTGFPYQRIAGALIHRGAVGTHACAVFMDAIAFVGSGRNEAIAVWIGASGSVTKLSTREIDLVLAEFTEAVLADVVMEVQVNEGHELLLIHLPDRTLVYDGSASRVLGEPVWTVFSSSANGVGQYLAKDFVYCYNKWLVGDPTTARLGYLDEAVSSHWGSQVAWEFSTVIVYSQGLGAIFHELELVALTGRAAFGADPRISTSYSLDGATWSTPASISAGKTGDRQKRLMWLSQGPMKHWRIQRFQGTSDAHLPVARLEARLEALAV